MKQKFSTPRLVPCLHLLVIVHGHYDIPPSISFWQKEKESSRIHFRGPAQVNRRNYHLALFFGEDLFSRELLNWGSACIEASAFLISSWLTNASFFHLPSEKTR